MIFSWVPSYGLAKTLTPSVNRSEYEGYSQRSKKGLNSNLKRWSIAFDRRTKDEADAIDGFLKDHAGVTSFQWTDRDGETLNYICSSHTKTEISYNNFSISCSFEQVA